MPKSDITGLRLVPKYDEDVFVWYLGAKPNGAKKIVHHESDRWQGNSWFGILVSNPLVPNQDSRSGIGAREGNR